MADLMKQTTSLEALSQKYENFAVPAIRILIGGKEITRECGALAENLQVRLSLDSSSSADFSLTNVYDGESRTFQSRVKKLVMLGKQIQIEMGYGSALEEVFAGYIYSIRYQVGDLPGITVAAMDVRRLMAENQKYYYTYRQKSCSAVVEEILKAYRPIYKEAVITKTDPEKEPDFKQKGSDLEFVYRLCRRSNREFLVCGSKLYFREPRAVEASILTLENGKSLLSFSREMLYKDEVIHVVVRRNNKEVLVESRKITTSAALVHSLGIPVEKFIVETDIKTREQAKDRLAKEAAETDKQCQAGSGSCIGLPDLVPGRYIEIAKMDSLLNGKYYLKQVEHSYGSDGFQTSFEVGGYDG